MSNSNNHEKGAQTLLDTVMPTSVALVPFCVYGAAKQCVYFVDDGNGKCIHAGKHPNIQSEVPVCLCNEAIIETHMVLLGGLTQMNVSLTSAGFEEEFYGDKRDGRISD